MTKSRRLSTNAENRPHIPPKSNVQEVIPISDAEEDEFLTVASYNVKKRYNCFIYIIFMLMLTFQW